MVRRTNRFLLLAVVLVLAPVCCHAGVVVDHVTGTLTFEGRNGVAAALDGVGSAIADERGTLTTSLDGTAALTVGAVGRVYLAAGSVVQFVRGGRWLRLVKGRLLFDLAAGAVDTFRLAYGTGYLTPTSGTSCSLAFDGDARAVLFVLQGTVRFVSKTVQRLLESGQASCWRQGGLVVKDYPVERIRQWWRSRRGFSSHAVVTAPGVVAPSVTALPSSPGKGLPAPPVTEPTVADQEDTLASTDVVHALTGAMPSPVRIYGRHAVVAGVLVGVGLLVVLFVGTVLFRRSRGRATGTTSFIGGLMGRLARLTGGSSRCRACGAGLVRGSIVDVPITGNVEACRPALLAYEQGGLMSSLWTDLCREVQSRRLMGDTRGTVALTYCRCPACTRTTYQLQVAEAILAEYGEQPLLSQEDRVSRRLQTFLDDYDPYVAEGV